MTKFCIVIDSDYDASILSRRLRAMGVTIDKKDAAIGIIQVVTDKDIKQLRELRGVLSVQEN
jgi:hypothetical protein